VAFRSRSSGFSPNVSLAWFIPSIDRLASSLHPPLDVSSVSRSRGPFPWDRYDHSYGGGFFWLVHFRRYLVVFIHHQVTSLSAVESKPASDGRIKTGHVFK